MTLTFKAFTCVPLENLCARVGCSNVAALREHLNALCERGALRARVDGTILHVDAVDVQTPDVGNVQGVVRNEDSSGYRQSLQIIRALQVASSLKELDDMIRVDPVYVTATVRVRIWFCSLVRLWKRFSRKLARRHRNARRHNNGWMSICLRVPMPMRLPMGAK